MSIKKLVIGLAVVAMAFAVVVPANAATIEELQAMIATLTQQLAALSGGTPTTGSAVQFNNNLTIGSTGADVTALQQYLVSKGFLQMPANTAYGYFGSVTQGALARYQASVGITPASGYFGPLTRADVNAKTMTTGGGTTGGGTTGGLEGDAGDITITEKNSGANDQVFEGEEGAKVVGMDIEADGSDVAITSIKVQITAPSTGSTRLNRYVDSVDVMMGDEVVGSADVGDFSKDGSVYTESINLDDSIVRDGDTERFYIAINAVNNVDSDDLSNALTAAVTQVRYEDATEALFSETVTTVTETFTLESLTTAGDLTLTLSEDDSSVNDPNTVPVDTSSDTNDVELMSFKLKAEDSDITVTTIPFTFTATGAGVTEILGDARLLMDGEEVGDIVIDVGTLGDNDDTFASSTDTEVFITATNLDEEVMIEDGDTVTFTLVADINDIDGAFTNGDSVVVALDADNITAEDDNGDTVGDTATKGTITTEGTAFASTGIMVSDFTTVSATEQLNEDGAGDNKGLYVMTFKISAFENPAHITLSAASSTAAASTDGVSLSIESAANAATQTGTTTATLERVSGGSITSNGRLKIEEGDTAIVRLTVYHDAAADDSNLRVQVNEVAFNDTDAAGDDAQATVPAADFQSSSVLINS